MFFFKFFLDISLSQKTMITFPFLDYSLLCSVGCPIRKRKTVNVCSSFFFLLLLPFAVLLPLPFAFVVVVYCLEICTETGSWCTSSSRIKVRKCFLAPSPVVYLCVSFHVRLYTKKIFNFFSFEFNWSVSVKRYLN